MLFFRLLGYLPFFLIYWLAWLSYLFLYYVLGYRKAVVEQNLRQAFPQKSQAEIRRLGRAFYRHLANLTFEIIKARTMSAREYQRRCSVVGAEQLLERTCHLQQPIIVLTIHQGNWEWVLHGVSLQLNLPIDPVYKRLHHRGWDQFVREVRGRFHSRPLVMAEAGRDILRRKDDFRLLVMLADQSPIAGESSYWCQYLNKEAAFHTGPEKMALLTGFPVFFAQCRCLKKGYYQLEFKELAVPPYHPAHHDPLHKLHNKMSHEILDTYVKMAEAAIREQPETFLWSNRRWRRRRQEEEDTAVSLVSENSMADSP